MLSKLNIITRDGARIKDPERYKKDVEILEIALKEEPDSTRYRFYLAQSYRDSGQLEKALENYEKRVAMGGWNQEVFCAALEIGVLKEALNKSQEEIIKSYFTAFTTRPSRLEPLYHLTNYYRKNNNFAEGYKVAKIAHTLPKSDDALFVQEWMYDYGLPLELSICAYWIGKYDECQKISMEILKKENLPEHVRTCVQSNLNFANVKIVESICTANLQEK